MARKHIFLNLDGVDWAEVGDRIYDILVTIKRDQKSLEEEAAKRGVNLGQMTAAAISAMLHEHLQAHGFRAVGTEEAEVAFAHFDRQPVAAHQLAMLGR
jgi:hypothetical protein